MSFYWSLLKPEALVIALYIEAVGMEACYSVVHRSVKSSSNYIHVFYVLCYLYLTCIRLVARVCHAMFMKTHFVLQKLQRKTTFFSIFTFFIFYPGTILNLHELAMQHMSDILHYNRNLKIQLWICDFFTLQSFQIHVMRRSSAFTHISQSRLSK